MIESIQPYGDRVLVEAQETGPQSSTGLDMAPKDRMNARLERPCRGVVIAVGPDVKYSAVGDVVYFGKYDNDEIEVNKKKLYFMAEGKLAGKVISQNS